MDEHSRHGPKVTDPNGEPGTPLKAVLLGYLTDVGGTTVAGTVFANVYSLVLSASGVSPEDARLALENIDRTAWGFTIISLLGCGCSVLGGYVCARVSRRTDYRLGIVLGVSSAVTGFLFSGDYYSPIQNILIGAVTLICVLLGIRYGMPRVAPQIEENRR